MPSCRTNSQTYAPPGAPAPRAASAPKPAKLHGQASWVCPQLENLRAPWGAGAPCGLRAPTCKVRRPGLLGASSTRKLTRPPGRRRPVWPPRPNPQSYAARPHGCVLNSQTYAPPGRRRPVWPPRPNLQSYTARPLGCALNSQTYAPPGAPAPRVASAPQPAKLHGQASWVCPQLANLRAPRGAGAPCGLRAPTRKVTRPGLMGLPSTRKLTRPPGRRRPVWPPRPNPQSYTAGSSSLKRSQPLRVPSAFDLSGRALTCSVGTNV